MKNSRFSLYFLTQTQVSVGNYNAPKTPTTKLVSILAFSFYCYFVSLHHMQFSKTHPQVLEFYFGAFNLSPKL